MICKTAAVPFYNCKSKKLNGRTGSPVRRTREVIYEKIQAIQRTSEEIKEELNSTDSLQHK